MSRTPIIDFELGSCPIETLILSTNLHKSDTQLALEKYLRSGLLNLLHSEQEILVNSQILSYQSNSREYTVLAKPSLLTAAL